MKLTKYQLGNLGVFLTVGLLTVLFAIFLFTQYLHFDHSKILEADTIILSRDGKSVSIQSNDIWGESPTVNVSKFEGSYSDKVHEYTMTFYRYEEVIGELLFIQLDPQRCTKNSSIILMGDYRYTFDSYFYDYLWSILKFF